ncbi:hypothetical protein M9H77_28593 [Catharanthus roseus]|uniref:Uncharacterized protein n=1 Tax=Catharanthus roseus TaxID=4058 RepID=A0ACC0AG25_CATRO|nr:hypothetical protein M9H77_28593 [Catharanthus roseus]
MHNHKMEFNDGGGGGGGNDMPPPAIAMEYPMRRRARGGRLLPPPFLTKMYQIVNDPNTSAIISWSSNNKSFIIFDQMKFTTEILPNYFKHSNFSSFVYQLNNYGFKKISWDKLEYENPLFQAGKENWLSNIRRRNQQSEPSDDFDNVGMEMETELEKLRREQYSMKVEIHKLSQQQQQLEIELRSFEESTISSANADFFSFIEVLKEKNERDNGRETSKRKMLVQDQVELNEMLLDGQIISSPDDDGDSGSSGIADNCDFWKKILEDDSDYGNGGQETLTEQDTKFITTLEYLMKANSENEDEILVPKALNNKTEEEEEEEEEEDHLHLV